MILMRSVNTTFTRKLNKTTCVSKIGTIKFKNIKPLQSQSSKIDYLNATSSPFRPQMIQTISMTAPHPYVVSAGNSSPLVMCLSISLSIIVIVFCWLKVFTDKD